MEEFQLYREKAAKSLKYAEHTLTFTYPVVRDTRILLGVSENLFTALKDIISSIVSYERLFKRIPPFLGNFESQYSIFRQKIAPRYNFDKEHIELAEKIGEIIKKHKECPVEFTRKDKLVFCSDSFNVETLGYNDLHQYLLKTKDFFNKINSITSKSEHLFSR